MKVPVYLRTTSTRDSFGECVAIMEYMIGWGERPIAATISTDALNAVVSVIQNIQEFFASPARLSTMDVVLICSVATSEYNEALDFWREWNRLNVVGPEFLAVKRAGWRLV